MFSRIFSGAALLLSSCGLLGSQDVDQLTKGDPILCALNGAADLAADCRAERTESGWIVHHIDDGGFRRISIAKDGRLTTDGAEPVMMQDDDIIAIGNDRYALPPR